MRARRQRRALGDVNLSPLIDMTFILLIFFMVTTTFVRDAELRIQRPGAQAAQASEQRTLRVSLDRAGRVFVDAQPIRPWMLQPRLRALLARHPVKKVIVVADRRVDTGKLVDTVDQCRLAGAAHVAVAVERLQ